jgi:hypothetical protein
MNHSKVVLPKPHRRDDVAWKAIQKVLLLFYLKLGKIHSTHFHVKLPIWNKRDLSVTNIKLNGHICNLKNLKDLSVTNIKLKEPEAFCLEIMSHLPIDYVTMFMQIMESGEQIGLKHFKPIKPLGSGDTGRYFFFSHVFPFQISNYSSTRCQFSGKSLTL